MQVLQKSMQGVLALMVAMAMCTCGSNDNNETRTQCNRSAALCAEPYNQVVYAATHNSMSNADDEWVLPNQIHGIEDQLASGIRALLIDIHTEGDRLLLCHKVCEEGVGQRDAVDAFSAIVAFLQTNRDAVLTLLIQDGQGVTKENTLNAMEQANLKQYLYNHPGGQQWPTLTEMVTNNTRLVVFAERHGGDTSGVYLHMWDFVSDTQFGHDSPEALRHDCAVNRGKDLNGLFLMNHWLYGVPVSSSAKLVNYRPFLDSRAKECITTRRLPNFIAVDFASMSDMVSVAAELNGIPENE